MDSTDQQQNEAVQEDAQISTSFFPPPPQVYHRFTSRNLALLKVVNDHVLLNPQQPPWESLDFSQRLQRQTAILQAHFEAKLDHSMQLDDDLGTKQEEEEEEALPDFDLKLELEKPNVELIEQDGGYTVFGQWWPIPDVIPTLEELGIPVLYPPESADRKQLLLSLLQTLLHTYRSLTADLVKPVQPFDVWISANPVLPSVDPQQQQQQPGFWTQSTEAKDKLKHIQNVVINMQFLINQLRPIQAKQTLKLMVQMQLERRKTETKLIRERCKAMRSKIEQIREMVNRQD